MSTNISKMANTSPPHKRIKLCKSHTPNSTSESLPELKKECGNELIKWYEHFIASARMVLLPIPPMEWIEVYVTEIIPSDAQK
jgi:hypothetical protein